DELLEQNPVLAHLAGGDLYRSNRRADLAMSLDIIGARRFLDEVRIETLERIHPLDRLPHLPYLVGIDHQRAVRSHDPPHDLESADIVVEIAPNLHLDMREAARNGISRQCRQLLLRIADPA